VPPASRSSETQARREQRQQGIVIDGRSGRLDGRCSRLPHA
jgi:hypothetical protein